MWGDVIVKTYSFYYDKSYYNFEHKTHQTMIVTQTLVFSDLLHFNNYISLSDLPLSIDTEMVSVHYVPYLDCFHIRLEDKHHFMSPVKNQYPLTFLSKELNRCDVIGYLTMIANTFNNKPVKLLYDDYIHCILKKNNIIVHDFGLRYYSLSGFMY